MKAADRRNPERMDLMAAESDYGGDHFCRLYDNTVYVSASVTRKAVKVKATVDGLTMDDVAEPLAEIAARLLSAVLIAKRQRDRTR